MVNRWRHPSLIVGNFFLFFIYLLSIENYSAHYYRRSSPLLIHVSGDLWILLVFVIGLKVQFLWKMDVLLFVNVLFLFWTHGSAEENNCSSLGFDKNVVPCSSCSDMVQFSLREVSKQCFKCCKDEENALEETKYPRAILEVCG
uniref:15 kDa selenoproteinlike [Bombyx mori] n=1 Tax=Lepeophtheirus salmonis TaxID=72036 RepID=A0A0K2UNZ4_LEPSM